MISIRYSQSYACNMPWLCIDQMSYPWKYLASSRSWSLLNTDVSYYCTVSEDCQQGFINKPCLKLLRIEPLFHLKLCWSLCHRGKETETLMLNAEYDTCLGGIKSYCTLPLMRLVNFENSHPSFRCQLQQSCLENSRHTWQTIKSRNEACSISTSRVYSLSGHEIGELECERILLIRLLAISTNQWLAEVADLCASQDGSISHGRIWRQLYLCLKQAWFEAWSSTLSGHLLQ